MLSRAEIKRLRALNRRAGRQETGLFLAEGVRLVEDLLVSSIEPEVAVIVPSLEDTPRGAALVEALSRRLRVERVAEHDLAHIAATDTPQGVVVAARIPRVTLRDAPLAERMLVVLLDAVQDPGNFGTIVRSADAFGAGLVVALPGTVDPWNPKAVRSAAGSSLRVPIVEADADAAVAHLRAAGFRILGAAADGQPVETLRSADRIALVLGNEGAGLGAPVRAMLDEAVAVPIRGAAESLNVGVAAGILLYLLSREL
jgi:RNA methyltransferase, TrmH family